MIGQLSTRQPVDPEVVYDDYGAGMNGLPGDDDAAARRDLQRAVKDAAKRNTTKPLGPKRIR